MAKDLRDNFDCHPYDVPSRHTTPRFSNRLSCVHGSEIPQLHAARTYCLAMLLEGGRPPASSSNGQGGWGWLLLRRVTDAP